MFIIALGILLTFWYLNSFSAVPKVPILSQLKGLPTFNVEVKQVVNGVVERTITCEGEGEIPIITWEPYKGAKCYALFVLDPDAPRGTFYHLIVLNITETRWPDGGKIYPNSVGIRGWYPVCPPKGETHRYFFIVLALKKCPEDPYSLITDPRKYVVAYGYVMGRFHG